MSMTMVAEPRDRDGTIEGGSWEDAILRGDLRQTLGLKTQDLVFGLRIAHAHQERGDLAGALRLFGALVLCDPTDPQFQHGLAQCGLAAGHFALAVQAASAMIASDPRSPAGFLISGLGCAGLGEREAAREDLDHAAQLAREMGDVTVLKSAERALAALADRTALD
ncbi:hypothetical protein [Aureimonas jatrophae]|nr:hypothetical protein [Aureimonas jatrophae]MBB3950336.1 Flp pilus assembly protein TadD [Aureimonas jatrophae]